MLIRFGLGGQLSGSVGGVTAAQNRYGQYLRNRTVPVNPNSTRQQAVRAAFSAATLAWRTLTPAQRAAWDAYAEETPILNRLGETQTPTGQAMYVSTNAFRIGVGATQLSAAPTSPGRSTLGAITSITINEESDIALVTVGGDAIGPAICQIGPPVSAGRTFFKGPYSFYETTALIATGGSFGAPLVEPFGPTTAGQRRPVRIKGSDATGRLSNAVEQIVTVTL